MIHIFICDDDAVHLRRAHRAVAAAAGDRDVTIHDLDSAAALFARLDEGVHPHVALLDVELESVCGINLAQELNRRCPDCQIIFLTAYARYASDAYFARHTWFVLKKDIDVYLPPALEQAFAAVDNRPCEEPALLVKQRRNLLRLPVSQVLYLERVTYRTKVVTTQETLYCTPTPAALLEGIPAGIFIRCHQSYWVNVKKIFSQVGSDFHLIDGSVVPISRTYRKDAIAAFTASVRR